MIHTLITMVRGPWLIHKVFFIFLVFTIAECDGIEESDGNQLKQKEAIVIAEKEWRKMFKDEDIDIYKPFAVKNVGDHFIVEGTLPEDWVGGVPFIKIRKKDRKIIEIYHTK